MAAGTDLSTLAAPLRYPISSTPVVVTVEQRSADYVWQGIRLAAPGKRYKLNYGPASATERDEARLHYEDNRGLTFPWTRPATEGGGTINVRYAPDAEPEFDRNQFANCSWDIELVPAS